MFTEKQLDHLRSCWVLPDGKLFPVPSEQHDNYLPDGYYKPNSSYNGNDEILQVEKKCFRMSFGWGWDAEISQMTIACDDLTEPQKQIIKYLYKAKIVKWNQISVISRNNTKRDLFQEILDEADTEIKK